MVDVLNLRPGKLGSVGFDVSGLGLMVEGLGFIAKGLPNTRTVLESCPA